MDGIGAGIMALGTLTTQSLPDGALKSLLVDGIFSGLGSVLVFLPQILILFLFILVLEESGYLPRAAFLLDRLMYKAGLTRSEEHTSELQSLMRISYAVFCLKKK